MSRTVQTTGIEFTKEEPLLVIVGRLYGKWNIQVSTQDKCPLDGQIYAHKMVERLQAASPGFVSFTEEWQKRSVEGAPAGPPFVVAPKLHHPTVVRQGEYVRYQCEYPFYLTAHRDFHVTPDRRSPDCPFDWSKCAESKPDGSYHVVIAQAVADLQHQRFYKSMAWVFLPDEQPVLIDPDLVGL